ncbi:MAG: hypothetical protein RRX93_06415 [Bacteroidales bacterium]
MAQQDENTPLENVESTFGKIEFFLERHQKLLIYIVSAIILLVGAYFGIKYLYIEPQEKTASTEMFYAERYFEMDSAQLALNGDGQHLGFLDIIDNYSITNSANLAHYYVGMIYLHTAKFEPATTYLKKFKTSDPILYCLTKQAIGDAYLEMDQKEEALKYYTEGTKKYKNEIITPGIMMRAGFVCEQLKKYEEALTFYKAIQQDYTKSQEAREMDKYIARIEQLKSK